MIKFLLISSLAMAVSKKMPEVTEGPYPLSGAPSGVTLVQCNQYPELGAPKDPSFDPSKHNWPAINGIKQNQKGPYACPHKLPDAGLSVEKGKYYYTVAGGNPPALEAGQKEQAIASRKSLSKGQKGALLQLEAGNPNWNYNQTLNGVRFRHIPITSKCLYDRVVFLTKDGKHYYNNWYRYLGVEEADKDYIPTLYLKDYKTPEQLLAELKEIPGCLE